ncbi:unnamed protein product [Leuciscus chuanchicus]
MADASIRTSVKDQASCPICQDRLKNPVTCNCGQSFCSVCVHGRRKQDSQKGSHSCPRCGKTFTPKPVPRKCVKVDEVLARMKKLELSSSTLPLEPTYDNIPGDVWCDDCTGRKHRAIKSCLTCVASFCESHLIPHTTVPSLKKHKLIEASSDLQENICSQHQKTNEFYCRTDKKSICASCALNEHKGHDTVEAETERTEKQTEIAEKRREVQQRIKDKQEELEELKQAFDTLKCSAQAALEENQKIFTQLIHTIEKTRSEVADLITAQEKMEYSRVARLHEQLEQEIDELHRREAELQKLLNMDNNVSFLQIFRSLQWTPPLHTVNSAFLKTTEKQHAVRLSDRIFNIQTDLISGPRYYAKKVYLDAVTGKLNGRKGYGGSILQFHIKGWEEKDRIVRIGLDTTVSPGAWNVLQLPERQHEVTELIRDQERTEVIRGGETQSWIIFHTQRNIFIRSYPGNPEFSREHKLNLLSELLWCRVMMLIKYAPRSELHQSHRVI